MIAKDPNFRFVLLNRVAHLRPFDPFRGGTRPRGLSALKTSQFRLVFNREWIGKQLVFIRVSQKTTFPFVTADDAL